MKPKHLFTIGYEGHSWDSFAQQLLKARVSILIDVRELPLSRKRGFSKRALASALAAIGIAYAHMPTLGCPKPIRDRLKAGGDWRTYVRGFEKHLAAQGAAVHELSKIASESTTCLLCFEADFNHCHRSIVGRAAVVAGAPSLAHITGGKVVPEIPLRRTA